MGNGFGTTLPTFSGQRSRSTVATVDGLNASEPSGSNLLSMTTSLDAISEVKVLRDNYAAEYGNNGGAMINMSPRVAVGLPRYGLLLHSTNPQRQQFFQQQGRPAETSLSFQLLGI